MKIYKITNKRIIAMLKSITDSLYIKYRRETFGEFYRKYSEFVGINMLVLKAKLKKKIP